MRTSRTKWLGLALLTVIGCRPEPSDTDGTAGAVDTEGAWTFIREADVPGRSCDLVEQDCDPGRKCVSFPDEPGSRNECVWDEGYADLDDSCQPYGDRGQYDECRGGLICLYDDLKWDFGVCMQHCRKASDCWQEGAICPVPPAGGSQVCRIPCNPLEQECIRPLACEPTDHGFICDPHGARMWPDGAACSPSSGCLPGLECVGGEFDPTCAGDMCCTALCDLDAFDPDASCRDGLTCRPWDEIRDPVRGAPPNLGLCAGPV